jgi:hypothetical protein
MKNTKKRALKCAKKQAAKRLRGTLLRHPYLAGFLSFVSSVLLDSAINYWTPTAWDWFCAFVRWLLS